MQISYAVKASFVLVIFVTDFLWANSSTNTIHYCAPDIEKKLSYETNYFDPSIASLNDSIEHTIRYLKIQHPHIVLAQARLESGHFKSKLFINNNNVFGMRLAGRRSTTAIGVKNGYANYISWRDAIVDYLLWQMNFARNLTEEEYLDKLNKYYAEDPNYIQKVKSTISKYKKNG